VAFTDDFTGTANQNLGDRGGWTFIEGTTSSAQINEANQLKSSTAQSSFKCTDQGSANHYTQSLWKTTLASSTPFIVIRLTDSNNFIGFRHSNPDWQCTNEYHQAYFGGSYTAVSTGLMLHI
jgi:hypothetical protein